MQDLSEMKIDVDIERKILVRTANTLTCFFILFSCFYFFDILILNNPCEVINIPSSHWLWMREKCDRSSLIITLISLPLVTSSFSLSTVECTSCKLYKWIFLFLQQHWVPTKSSYIVYESDRIEVLISHKICPSYDNLYFWLGHAQFQ
jgi:hypothetical protein